MTILEWISLGKAILTILAIIGLGVFFLILYNRNNIEKNRIQEFSVTSSLTIDHSIPEKLDLFIQENLTEYLVLNIHILENNQYINEELETEIRDGFTQYISDRISPIFIQQLSVYYNVDNIHLVLANKIYIAITNYVANMNSPVDDGRDIVNRSLPDYTDMRNSAGNVTYIDPTINF